MTLSSSITGVLSIGSTNDKATTTAQDCANEMANDPKVSTTNDIATTSPTCANDELPNNIFFAFTALALILRRSRTMHRFLFFLRFLWCHDLSNKSINSNQN